MDYFRSPGRVAAIARRGTKGSAQPLPHLDAVQRSFGRHDISGVRAHVGGAAETASAVLGAEAFASGGDIAFSGAPDIRTAAHEAAHVVQQRAGAVTHQGLSEDGDVHERHANDVAEMAAGGRSAEASLDQLTERGHVAGEAATGAAVQRAVTKESISETTDTGNTYTQSLQVDTSKNTVLVSVAINWIKAGTWTDDKAFQAFVAKVKSAVNTYMNNTYKIVATPKDATGGKKAFEMPCSVQLVDDSSGVPVKCYGATHGRSAMQSGAGDLYELGQANETTVPPVGLAHEFGHALLGQSDEYANPAMPHRVLTNDNSIMGDFYSQGIDKAEFKVRHFAHLLAPVAAHYPGYTLTIKKA